MKSVRERMDIIAAYGDFLVSNQTGVQGVFSSSGATDELALYSPYGQQMIESESNVTPFGFQGSYTDSTGFIYLLNRYYDSTTDQFISIDPDVAMKVLAILSARIFPTQSSRLVPLEW